MYKVIEFEKIIFTFKITSDDITYNFYYNIKTK